MQWIESGLPLKRINAKQIGNKLLGHVALTLFGLYITFSVNATGDHDKEDLFISFAQTKDRASRINARNKSGSSPQQISEAQRLQKKFLMIPESTPLIENDNINAFAKSVIGHDIKLYFKNETTNPSGSFKDRMPILFFKQFKNMVVDPLRREKTDINIISVSTGNHGRASLTASLLARDYLNKMGLAHQFNINTKIFMSKNAMPHKKAAIKALGGIVVDHYHGKSISSYAEAEALALAEVAAHPQNNILLPHADANAINGYAVIAKEVETQVSNKGIALNKLQPERAVMLAPLGSGGLLAGVSQISVDYPNIHSYGITAAPADITFRSLAENQLLRKKIENGEPLIVDGVMATPEQSSLDRIPEFASGVMNIKQKDALYATALLKIYDINIEPTAGLPLAAILLGKIKDFNQAQYAFIVLTGKNISQEMKQKVQQIVDKGEFSIMQYFKSRRVSRIGKRA